MHELVTTKSSTRSGKFSIGVDKGPMVTAIGGAGTEPVAGHHNALAGAGQSRFQDGTGLPAGVRLAQPSGVDNRRHGFLPLRFVDPSSMTASGGAGASSCGSPADSGSVCGSVREPLPGPGAFRCGDVFWSFRSKSGLPGGCSGTSLSPCFSGDWSHRE